MTVKFDNVHATRNGKASSRMHEIGQTLLAALILRYMSQAGSSLATSSSVWPNEGEHSAFLRGLYSQDAHFQLPDHAFDQAGSALNACEAVSIENNRRDQ